nr:helix-turn-helix transcriptional regulator [Bacteroidota bacterium]
MKTTINERVEILIRELGLTTNGFALRLGLNPNVIYNTIKGKSKPAFDVINSIIETFDVNADWLIKNVTPDGTPILGHKQGHKQGHKNNENTLIRVTRENIATEKIENQFNDAVLFTNAFRHFSNIMKSNQSLSSFFEAYGSLREYIELMKAFMREYVDPFYNQALSKIELSFSTGKIDKKNYQEVIELLKPLTKFNPYFEIAADGLGEALAALKQFDENEILFDWNDAEELLADHDKTSINQSEAK